MSAKASVEISQEDTAQESGFGRSSWVQRRFRRLVIGAVVSGVVLSGVTGMLLRSRKKP